MDESANASQELNQYEIRKQRKEEGRETRQRSRQRHFWMRVGLFGGIALVVVVGSFIWMQFSGPQESNGSESESNIVSNAGIHWHARLRIIINGEEYNIPKNLGLSAIHASVHTHDDEPGLIHMEFSRLVTKDDIRLSEFFKVWDKTFSSSCIFEFCNDSSGTVRTVVNGQENNEFERYIMRDGDVIDIIYN